MERYDEFLFEADTNDIAECLYNLTEDDVKTCSEYQIFRRGYEYYHDGRVEHLHLNKSANTINATVIGTQEYTVEFYIENGEVCSTCTCPYYGVCKHTVAVLLYIVDEDAANLQESNLIPLPANDPFEYLKSKLEQLSKEELINLVIKFAPENYKQQVFNSKLNKEDSIRIYHLVEKKVLGFFKDEELLWDPSSMDSALMGQLGQLKGLENQLTGQISKLLLAIMNKVNEAFDEGYLYIDDYYEDDYFESEQFNHYVIAFVNQLSYDQKLNFIQQLDDTIGNMSYDTFHWIAQNYSSCFSKKESKRLAKYVSGNLQSINGSFASGIYDTTANHLTINEKEQILIKLSDAGSQDHLILLVELLISQNRQTQAFSYLKKYLSGLKGYIDNKIIELYLTLAFETGSNIEEAAMKAFNHNQNEKILSKIKSLGILNLKPYEEKLRDENPEGLLKFYEKEKRLDDALQLVSAKDILFDYEIFSFFKRNKKTLSEQAEQYFMHRIDTNLVNTGEKFYNIIVETIDQIIQINNKLANEIVKDIKTNYKRRTKLMSMLRQF